MKQNTYNFAHRSIDTTRAPRTGFLLSMQQLRNKFRASREYGSMKTYFVRNH